MQQSNLQTVTVHGDAADAPQQQVALVGVNGNGAAASQQKSAAPMPVVSNHSVLPSSSTSPSGGLFPSPIVPYMRTSPVLKMLVPFLFCITALIFYAALDNEFPSGTSYGSLEYSRTPEKFQQYIDGFTPVQYCTVGFSIGLHLFNSVAYAVTLTVVSAFCSLHLRAAGHSTLAKIADIFTYLQVFTFTFYVVEHTTVLAMFLQQHAGAGQPEAVYAFSVMFLVLICAAVIFCIAVLVWTLLYKHQHNGLLPATVAERQSTSGKHRAAGAAENV